MKLLQFFSIFAIGSLLTACGGAQTSIAKSDQARITSPSASPEDQASLVAGNNAFALDLYRVLSRKEGNLIFSPYSMSIALAMTYGGARGDTETQMGATLRFDLPQDRLHPSFNALDLRLESAPDAEEEQPLQLRIANAVWAEQTHTFLPEFLDTLALNYGAGVQLADFVNQPEPSRIAINDWVSDQTEDKIKDLIPQGAIDSMTRMVLVNAIYFNADWLSQFDAADTVDMPFHLLDGSQVSVPTMNQGVFVPYAVGDGWQAIELPYAGETAAMDILVPDADRFEEIEATLTGEEIAAMMDALEPASVQLALPKFEFTSEFGMVEPLRELGMTDAFDEQKADFSGMDGTRELLITDVVHKAFVAVDEEGTEAAAATGVIVGVTSAPLFDITLTIDRPFLFVIRDLQSGQILFMGRVMDPSQ